MKQVDPTMALALIDSSILGDIRWAANRTEREGTPPVYASDLGSCARRISYKISGIDGDPFDETGRHVVSVGTAVHDRIETLATATPTEREEVDRLARELHDRPSIFGTHPGIRFESTATKFTIGDPVYLAGRFDIDDPEQGIMSDHKTIATTGLLKLHKWAAGGSSWGAPNASHVLQVGAAAYALGYETCRISYIGKENFLPSDARKFRESTGLDLEDMPASGMVFEVEWSIADGEPEHARLMRALARAETIHTMAADGELAPMVTMDMPSKARIVRIGPNRDGKTRGFWEHRQGGELVDTGTAWQCGYCPYVEHCETELAEPGMQTCQHCADDAVENGRCGSCGMPDTPETETDQ